MKVMVIVKASTRKKTHDSATISQDRSIAAKRA